MVMVLFSFPRCRVPFHDAAVGGIIVNDPEAAEPVPGDALGAAEVAGDFRADFLGDADRLGHRVAAHPERPRRLGVGPGLRGAAVRVPGGAVGGATLRDEGLLDEPARLVAAGLAVEDEDDAGLGVMV